MRKTSKNDRLPGQAPPFFRAKVWALTILSFFGSEALLAWFAFSFLYNQVWAAILLFFPFGIAAMTHQMSAEKLREGHKNKEEIMEFNVFSVIGRIFEVRHTRTEEQIGVETQSEGYNPYPVDFDHYMQQKGSNQNIMVSGMPGSGKTELLYFLISWAKERKYKRIIFTYKNTDRYTELGIPTFYLRTSAPDIFKDKNSFIESWTSSLIPDASTGIIAGQIPGYLRKIVNTSNSWKEFETSVNKEIRYSRDDMVSRGALKDIELKMHELKVDKEFNEPLPDEIVISFEDMSENAFKFYAEFFLRQLYKEIRSGKRKGTMIFIDEGKVFLKGQKSIIIELANIIRSNGAIVLSTQQLSDISGPIKGAAGTQFTFKQTEREDLEVSRSLSEQHRWISQLPLYTFIDLNQLRQELGLYIYQIIHPRPIFMPLKEWNPSSTPQPASPQASPQPTQDPRSTEAPGTEASKPGSEDEEAGDKTIEDEILQLIAGDMPRSSTWIVNAIASKHGLDPEQTRLKFMPTKKSSPIYQLIHEGRLSDFIYDSPRERGEVRMFYAGNTYQGHDFVVSVVRSILGAKGYKPEIQERGASSPDIIDKDEKLAIEVEMDTKAGKKIDETEERIHRMEKEGYQVVIVAPGRETKGHLFLSYNGNAIYTPREFERSFPSKPERGGEKSNGAT